MSEMTPREIVSELDQHIIGQKEAKRAVAIALRNRWRRMQLQEPLRHEVTPKNILMIGPTGVGKTEIARRLAKLANAPFIKVEATKFTEVGYVGKEVDSIIRDLTDSAMKLVRQQEIAKNRAKAEDAAEDRILDALLPPPKNQFRFLYRLIALRVIFYGTLGECCCWYRGFRLHPIDFLVGAIMHLKYDLPPHLLLSHDFLQFLVGEPISSHCPLNHE